MWLSSDHLGLGVIGLTANIGLAYTLKFLWAPVFDEIMLNQGLESKRRATPAILQEKSATKWLPGRS